MPLAPMCAVLTKKMLTFLLSARKVMFAGKIELGGHRWQHIDPCFIFHDILT